MILGTMHIEGPPQPKQRARTMTLPGGKRRTYTPAPTVAYEALIGYSWRGKRDFTGAVKLTIRVIEGVTNHPGDLDNYVKSVLDGLNRIAYADDKQVIAIDAAIIRKDARPGLDVLVEGFPS